MMNLILFMMLMMMIIFILLMIINSIFSNNKMKYLSKSNIECGFSNMSYSKTPFSNQFFIMLIIFLIFDMELIVLLPTPENMKSNKFILLMSLITILLVCSLIMEWMSGLLEWSKS